jgi:2-methylisocitrate lyase-like PEP mutase family enzyme
VAGIQIEDQVFPKKCGHYEGKQIIPTEEMVQKIKAAVDTRKEDDLVIIARTDAIAVRGFEDALDRGQAYTDAGADVLFIEAPNSIDEIRTIGRSFDIPLLFNMPTSGKTPLITASEMERLGYKIALYAGVGMYIYAYIIKKYLKTLLSTGSWEDYKDEMVPFKDFWNMMGLQEIRKIEEKYIVK